MKRLLLLVALLVLVRPAYSQVTVSTASVVPAGMGTPASNGLACSGGMASAATGSFYLQRDAVGNGIWKCTLASDGATYAWIAPANNLGILSSTASIGGAALLLGATTSGTATVTGAVVGTPCIASTSDGTFVSGVNISCNVTAANVATVTLQAVLAGTPVAKTYNVRVIQ